MNQTETEERTLTPDELKAKKAEMLKYFEEEIPFLTKKKEYDSLITEIDELYMRRCYALRKAADIMAPDPTQDTQHPPTPKPLKKV